MIFLSTYIAYAQNNPLAPLIISSSKERVLFSLAQSYCQTKVRWEQFYSTAISLKPALDSISPDINELLDLLRPGGRLYNLVIGTWYNNYVNGFNSLKPLVLNYLINLQGLISASNAAASYLDGMYGQTLRAQLIREYSNQFSQSSVNIQNYLQNYMANEMMAELSNTTQLLHYKELLVILNATSVTPSAINNLNTSLIESVVPAPETAWYSFTVCSTDYSNNTYKLCFTDLNATTLYGPLFVGFQVPSKSNAYLYYYSEQLGGSCPVNYIQIHTYMMQLYSLYNQIYSQYSSNVMPWEIRLIVTQNVLQGVLGSLANDLLSPLLGPLSKLSTSTASSVIRSCLSVLNNVNVDITSTSLRNYPNGMRYLQVVATNLENIYKKLYRVVDCINFYIPQLQRVNNAYLSALKSRFESLANTDIELWATNHGINCEYTPSVDTVSAIKLVVRNYIAILDPNSPSSFVNTVLTNTAIISFPNVLPPTSLSEGGICG